MLEGKFMMIQCDEHTVPGTYFGKCDDPLVQNECCNDER